ncbi:MAG: DUF1343 domain-containing protein [Balneolaceae bacterium]
MFKYNSPLIALSIFLLISLGCEPHQPELAPVKTGAQNLLENHLGELDGKRVGLVMNPTAVVGSVHMLDTLIASGVDVSALFAPEHGFRGEAGAGDVIEDGIDQGTGLPVFSLYGSTRKPTGEMLDTVDILLFDMQDVGARFYTYYATMGLVFEAAAEAGKPVWILDRPNPMGGDYVSGWMMEDEYTSFVGPYSLPVAHGMTMGELAQMMVGEKWLDSETEPEINVVTMSGWNRDMKWPDTGLNWVAPSPNLPTFEHAMVYLGTCFIEGTTLSEGRGTNNPFLTLGSPDTVFEDGKMELLNTRIDYASISETEFLPEEIPGVATSPKHEGELSRGIQIQLESFQYDPVRNGLLILKELMDASAGAETNSFLYRLAGTQKIDSILDGTEDPLTIDFGLDEFKEMRELYLLY